MYQLDTNINTAVERQADRVRAVQACGTGHAAAAWTTGDNGQTNTSAAKAIVALAAAAPIVALLAWVMVAR